MATITINGVSIDPQRDSEEMALAGLDSSDASTSDYILVQSSQPLLPDQRELLRQAGAEVLAREQTDPPGSGATYLCRFPGQDLEAVRRLPFVAAALLYPRQVKVAPELLTPEGTLRFATFEAGLSPQTTMAQEPRDVSIILHPGRSVREVAADIARAARLDSEGINIEDEHIVVRVLPQHLADIANVDAVHHIEEYTQPKFFGAIALNIIEADRVHTAVNLDGNGEIVAVCDTGFDQGSTVNPHPAFAGRVLSLYALGRATPDDPDGHGTHVSGSVLGDGSSVSMGGPIRGAAPGAQLVLQSVLNGAGGLSLPSNLGSLFAQPYNNDGARIHTNSWGSAAAGRYTARSSQVDDFVWSHRDCLVCFAAGNEGVDGNANGIIDAGSIGSPATAKNCLSVGASESARPGISKPWGGPWASRYPAQPIASDLWADNHSGMAAFSSRGPTRDGRIKPDVVAPGTAILSARSRNALVGSFWGASSDPDYCFMGGTSMATPLVAGSAAVVRQFLRQQNRGTPSAALLKAMLINGATDMAGQYVPSEAGVLPNNAEGFGRINLARSVNADQAERLDVLDEGTALDTGEEYRVSIPVECTGRILKVTLVWSDPPGSSLQNDLDLIVVDATGDERHGNMPAQSPQFDRKNNVEQVEWVDIAQGDAEIIVRAHDTPRFRQDFALVIRLT
ncbi:S8 family serine peptidase [Tahibacter amnicola]|uniref:S8 family serine peptidase n=1 Tax=Tahibacter amnicola TaxID=2976241 RepID=A0ABY6BR66_9GAMM|nr:S8 family serine peptidase [Tahibacter amnicola]UXI70257.1 S8 family serine peptidase [Tahibacter amnicola]